MQSPGLTRWRLTPALIALMLLSLQASASTVTVFESKRPRHLGSEEITAWDVWTPEGPVLAGKFTVEGPFRRVWVDVLVYGVERANLNPVLVNNRTVAYICMVEAGRWGHCVVDIPVESVGVGVNTFRLESVADFMMKDLKLNVEYIKNESYVVVSKSQSAREVRVGEPVNVSITVTNIGAEPVLNVSARDVKPPGTYIRSGSTEGGFDLLRGGDIYRYQYTLVLPETGVQKSWPGSFVYYDREGNRYEGAIEATVLTVKPPKPEIQAFKSISYMTVFVGSSAEIQVTVVNNGTVNASNVRVYDPLPENFTVKSGAANATYETLEAGRNVSFKYDLSPKTPGLYSSRAEVYYEDGEGSEYMVYSNHIQITARGISASGGGLKPLEALLIIVAVAFLLAMVYLRIKK